MEEARVEPVGDSPEEGVGLDNERQLAAVAYVLTFITGIVVLLLAQREQRYARWHAIQAIGIGLVSVAVGFALRLASAILWWVPDDPLGPFVLPFPFVVWGLSGIVQLITFALAITLAVKAYGGETVRLPLLADLADDHA